MKNKILLVDDEPNVLEGIKRALSEEPYEVLVAESGAEALSILEETLIDVIVADQDMPGMSGTELLSQICNEHPAIIRIMLTGKVTAEVAIDAINAGAVSQFLTKPCSSEDIALAIHQALIKKNVHDEGNKQINALGNLERENPGITHLNIDSHGAINIEELPPSPDET